MPPVSLVNLTKWIREARERPKEAVGAANGQPTPKGARLLILEREGHRNRHSRRFADGLIQAGWQVVIREFLPTRPLFGIPEYVTKDGPFTATLCWEEHGCLFLDRRHLDCWRWCYDHGVLPLNADFGWLDHYQTYYVDRYDRAGRGTLEAAWDDLPYVERPVYRDPRIAAYVRGIERAYREARSQPPLRPPGYVAVWTQFSPKLSRLRIGRGVDWLPWCLEADKRLKAGGERPVFKTSPVGKPTDWDMLRRMGVDVLDTDSRSVNPGLAVHAKYNLAVCTSLLNEFAIAGLPTITTGRSWFTGKGVLVEAQTWDDIGRLSAQTPSPLATARLLQWFSDNLAYIEGVPARINRLVADWPVTSRLPASAVITTVFAPTSRTERVALASMAATAREFPDSLRIAAIDAASPELEWKLASSGWTILRLQDGKPPRMGRLLGEALKRCESHLVWTIEMDAFIQPGVAAQVERLLVNAGHKAAAVECESVDGRGKRCHPTEGSFKCAKPVPGNQLLVESTFATFNCTCWRRAALEGVNWASLPPLCELDKRLAAILKHNRTWHTYLAPGLRCVHDFMESLTAASLKPSRPARLAPARRFLHPGRMLAIGYGIPGVLDLLTDGWSPGGPLCIDDASVETLYCGCITRSFSDDQWTALVEEVARILEPRGNLKVMARLQPERVRSLEAAFDLIGHSDLGWSFARKVENAPILV